MKRNRILLLGICAILIAACNAPERPRNLLLISVDTLRADRLGCYGYERPTSPAIDRLAAGGALFEDASATSPWTKPSHASLLTGLYPTRNGALTMQSLIHDDVVHLASHLGDHGFRTGAVVNAQWLTMHGLERGFTDFESVDVVQGRREGSPVTEEAIRWLRGLDRSDPFFAFVHYMDVHSDYASLPLYEEAFVEPYSGVVDGSTAQLYDIADGLVTLDAEDARHLENLYDAGIRQVDEQLSRLFAYLDEEGLLEHTLVVLTSDHGEEFFEHGSVLHGKTQYQEVVRVPLLFSGPGVARGARIATPVSLIDVMPTCLELLGRPAPAGLDGVPLRSTWGESASDLDARLLYLEADVTYPPPGPGPVPIGSKRAARDGRYKLTYDLASRDTRLFDLLEDPGETRDVKLEHAGIAARLLKNLLRHLDASNPDPEVVPLSEEELEALRSLGYVGR